MENDCWDIMVKGDKEAFLAIYHNHYRALFTYGFSITADKELTKDCIQELFLDIWNTRPTLNKEVENVRSYLFTWLRRKVSRRQSRLSKERSGEQSRENNETQQCCYEELLIAFQQGEEKKEHLARALDTLTKKQLEIIRLKFFDNLSYAEISQKTSLSTRTVYNLIYEAIIRLRESMAVLL
jgi:RNA polymerase sigma factor (sigma-70 family)